MKNETLRVDVGEADFGGRGCLVVGVCLKAAFADLMPMGLGR
ncbi:hypothetical protein [Bartonella jaculi]